MADKNYIAAEATDVFIGDLRFDGIRIIETGEYRMSQKQALESAGEQDYFLTRLPYHAPEVYQKLMSKGFDHPSISVQYTVLGKNGRKVVTRSESLSLKQVRILWRFLDKEYDKVEAEQIIDALGEDSLRDRFDQAYGLDRLPVDQRRQQDSRIMSEKRKFHPLFGDENVDKITKLLDCGRGSAKIARWFWEYIYYTLTPQERADLDRVNPVINGKRKDTIHQWLEESATVEHRKHFDQILFILRVSNTEQEFRENFRRMYNGYFQQGLFE